MMMTTMEVIIIIVLTAVRGRPHETQIFFFFFAEKLVPPVYDVEEPTWLPESQGRAEHGALRTDGLTERKAPVNTVSQGHGVSLVMGVQQSC